MLSNSNSAIFLLSPYFTDYPTDKVSTPVIEMNPNTTNHDVGAFAILSCNAKGYPSPLIDNHINYFLWTFRPRGKSDDVILISNNGLLGLQNLQPENSGRYTCTAHNGFSGQTFSSQSYVDISVHPGNCHTVNFEFNGCKYKIYNMTYR